MQWIEPVGLILKAVAFASQKHATQRRKDPAATPYINHPVEVARILYEEGGVRDPSVLVAALLHDTIEDTDATFEEIETAFGSEIAEIVAEVTDDTTQPKLVRKERQVSRAATISHGAQQLKIADKISNLRDIFRVPPVGWSPQRQEEYFHWAARVVAQVRGCNPTLEAIFDEIHERYFSSKVNEESC